MSLCFLTPGLHHFFFRWNLHRHLGEHVMFLLSGPLERDWSYTIVHPHVLQVKLFFPLVEQNIFQATASFLIQFQFVSVFTWSPYVFFRFESDVSPIFFPKKPINYDSYAMFHHFPIIFPMFFHEKHTNSEICYGFVVAARSACVGLCSYWPKMLNSWSCWSTGTPFWRIWSASNWQEMDDEGGALKGG